MTFRTPRLSLGFSVQCRADVYNPQGCEASLGQPFLADIKTIGEMDDFPKHFHQYGYYRQAPFYQRVIRTVAQLDSAVVPPVKAFFIAVEKQEPHGCTVYEADAASITLGLREIDSDLARLAECYRSGVWPNSPDYQQVFLPAWYLDRRSNELATQEKTMEAI